MLGLPGARRAIGIGLLPVLLACLTIGCGNEKTYRVSGKVTFKGQPVPEGRIFFMPDPSKGNKGPSGSAEIKNGRYDTDAGGRGVVGGAMLGLVLAGVRPDLPRFAWGSEEATLTALLGGSNLARSFRTKPMDA